MAQFSIIPERALRDPGITGSRLFALCAIGRFTSRGGKGVWAKNSTIAKVAGLDDRHYRRAVRWLVEQGYVVKRSRQKADGSADTNWLEILYDDPPPMTIGAEDDAGNLDEVGAESAPTSVRAKSARTPRAKSAPTVGAESAHQRASIKGSTASPPPDDAPLADRFTHVPHREAYVAMRRSARFPHAFDATLQHELHQPLTGGAGYAWDVIGASLLQLAGNGETFNVIRLRGYCRSHAAGPTASGRSGPRPTTAELAVRVGADVFTAPAIWQLCVDVGLTSPMQSRETVRESIAKLAARGAVRDPDEFLRLVTAVDPPALAEIKFAKTREERLRERLVSWALSAPGRAA